MTTTSKEPDDALMREYQHYGSTLAGLLEEAELERFTQASLSKLNPSVRKDWHRVIGNMAMGIGGEGGEIVDTIKKLQYHDKTFDRATLAHLIEELGDLMFYVSILAYALNVPLRTIMQANMRKLNARYNGAFNLAQFNDKATTDRIVHEMMMFLATERFVPDNYDENNPWEL